MTATWRGLSGKKYTYMDFQLSHKPPKDTLGNYIFAKQLQSGTWYAIYVGQGNLLDRYNAALEEGCVTKKGATRYQYHTDHQSSRKNRLEEEADIIEGNTECKHPIGCNGTDP